MATFHPFPRLIPEIRAHIWALAIENRVIQMDRWKGETWSPYPTPAVTRACYESRKHCSYQKCFFPAGKVRYIWINFDHDIIQIGSGDLWPSNTTCVGVPIGVIKHLRVEVVNSKGEEDEDFWWPRETGKDGQIATLSYFPKLKSVDILVPGVYSYTQFLRDCHFGAGYARVVDMRTGEWIDKETGEPYRDCIDSARARAWGYETDSADEEESNWQLGWEEDRIKDMKELQMPRPRINLDYQ